MIKNVNSFLIIYWLGSLFGFLFGLVVEMDKANETIESTHKANNYQIIILFAKGFLWAIGSWFSVGWIFLTKGGE